MENSDVSRKEKENENVLEGLEVKDLEGLTEEEHQQFLRTKEKEGPLPPKDCSVAAAVQEDKEKEEEKEKDEPNSKRPKRENDSRYKYWVWSSWPKPGQMVELSAAQAKRSAAFRSVGGLLLESGTTQSVGEDGQSEASGSGTSMTGMTDDSHGAVRAL